MEKRFYKLFKSLAARPRTGSFEVCFIFFMISSSLQADPRDTILCEKWAGNTAFTMPSGKWESGVFQAFRFGLNEKIELRSNAVLMPLLPNAGIKFSLRSGNTFFLASEHSISCPTVFLNALSFKGIGGLISPQYNFPFIITLSNSLIASKLIGSSSLLTADAGFALALRGYKPDFQSSIDIPFIYQRMAHYYEGISLKSGLSVKGTILNNLFFEEGARIFLITRSRDNFFIENSGAILWSGKGSLRIKAGYLLSWGNYPFGNHLQFWPAVDFIFGSRQKQKISDN